MNRMIITAIRCTIFAMAFSSDAFSGLVKATLRMQSTPHSVKKNVKEPNRPSLLTSQMLKRLTVNYIPPFMYPK